MRRTIDAPLAALVQKIRLLVFDFDGVFTDNCVYVSATGAEMVRCWRSDGLGLRLLEKIEVGTLVISTEENPVVSFRCKKMKIRCIQGCEDKVASLSAVAAQEGIEFEEIGYVGNDINDSGCLERVALPIVVRDAHQDVVGLAKFRTRTRGGYGAVREVCDLFYSIRSKNITS